MPPWLKSLTRLATSPPHSGTAPPQPESTETYCSPSISQVTGEPRTPEPVWNSQTFSPVLALNAWRKPSGVPVNTRLPLVVSTPPHSGAKFLWRQTSLPLIGSMARSTPM